jgi:hypothetical protein
MIMEQKKNSWISALIIGLCLVAAFATLAFGLLHFRSRSTQCISATGSASVDFDADLVIWRGSFSAVSDSSKDAYAKLKSDSQTVKRYLTSKGISEDAIVFDAVDIGRTYEDTYDANGNYAGSHASGYELSQRVTVTSSELDVVENVSREISELLDQGIELTSASPEYYYTKLDALKLDLIDKASANAKERIDIIAKNTGSKPGKLKNSSLGVFQITAQNTGTSSYSYDGAYDTSSRHKTATITVHLEFGL